jgi:hypothetical protein
VPSTGTGVGSQAVTYDTGKAGQPEICIESRISDLRFQNTLNPLPRVRGGVLQTMSALRAEQQKVESFIKEDITPEYSFDAQRGGNSVR